MDHPEETDLDVAPDEPGIAPETNLIPFPAQREPIVLGAPPIEAILPQGFRLDQLLTFIPDIRLKRGAEAMAEEALAIDVSTPDGFARADASLSALRERIATIEECFAEPVDRANQLHKRLTGLRTDFTLAAVTAVKTVGQRVVAEDRRLKDLADAARRQAQAEADRQAREAAARAAREAAKANAHPNVVARLEQAAKSATAAPVASPAASAPLASTSVVQRWKARLRGSPAEAEPNPKVADLSKDQQEQARKLCAAIGRGEEPLSAVELNWSYLNKRAGAEKAAFAITGLEAFDEGGTRSRGRR